MEDEERGIRKTMWKSNKLSIDHYERARACRSVHSA